MLWGPRFITSVAVLLSFVTPFASADIDDCQDACSDYNSILVSCNYDADQESVYDSCVCNTDNFATYVDECIDCEGTDSKPAEFKKSCKSVPPDCTSACEGFGLVIQGCGDTSSPDFHSCVCAGAYDEQYSNTFNEDFQNCVTCENGGGQAAYWEAYCCAASDDKNCNGMSSEASDMVESISVSATMDSGSASQTAEGSSSSSSSNDDDNGGSAATHSFDGHILLMSLGLCFLLLVI
ncbi:hypothetical protein NM208_g3489 [Fusarium decemcellulare]|uniref:Uncharacterized protein n=1 Tax=Fusarium decemcellulare TaxID=57161 RepID=A0ACC1SNW6_9HYPO|nr:hypothetical protein NM208_g3489 [Fusarium decemcellulare]